MNDILYLNGNFEKRANPVRGGIRSMPRNKTLSASHLMKLSSELRGIYDFWQKTPMIEGALITVHYVRIVPKSLRLCRLLSVHGESPSESVRGARFEDVSGHLAHVFTHYVPLETLTSTIKLLEDTGGILASDYADGFTETDYEEIRKAKEFPYKERILKTAFLDTVFDATHVSYFNIDTDPDIDENESVLTLYRTDVKTIPLLSELGINITPDRMLDETTIRLYSDEIDILKNRAPYLISMSVKDLNEISPDEILDEGTDDGIMPIPHPGNEPVIGVIDSYFNPSVYFSEWVDNRIEIEPQTEIEYDDMAHGTAVDSIIVDGPRLNPFMEDGCGRFRVRHFGISGRLGFSSFTFTKILRRIVSSNPDIKVWNISIGSIAEIHRNSISPAAAEIDRLECEFDVIFVIAGTNRRASDPEDMRIGAPADSLNSLVVNAVDYSGEPASYSRKGPVLSFFHKPDVSYYGGDRDAYDYIAVECGNGITQRRRGTSFAAPWIARKLAYLIQIMGMSRETAKALIIDSAAGWHEAPVDMDRAGYGAVPIHISNILRSEDDEIKFILTGAAEEYETYTYGLPVPIVQGTQPFYARATLVYFPQCERNQGVDYTNTELDIHFGRIRVRNDRPCIMSLNSNTQSDAGSHCLYEEEARNEFRKWDNVKHISDTIRTKRIPRKVMESGLWGLSIKAKEMLSNKHKDPIPFAVIITLKEMNGKNRIDDFMKLCMAKGWFVKSISAENQLDIYRKAEEEVEFD